VKLPPQPPPVPERERTLTRRTVKGAAGGMEGVDYTPEPASGTEPVRASVGAGSNREDRNRDRTMASKGPSGSKAAAKKAGEALTLEGALVRNESEMILEDEDATTRETKNKQRQRVVYRDRMTVDKDAPQLIRKRRFEEPEEDAPEAREAELDLVDLGAAISAAGDGAVTARGHLFEGQRSRVGDPNLTDPEDMIRVLGTPAAYARHALLLAESFRTLGATRTEAIGYLGRLFVAVGDRGFARNALKELGPGTGIIDLYPLEVMAHLLETYPGFLPRAGFGRLFTPGRGKTETLHLRPGVPRLLRYSADLKVRGFALSGGGRPGYTFEPGPETGRYSLRIDTPGEYELLVSAVTKSGHTIIDRLDVKVRGKLRRPRAESLVERNEAGLRAWPIPAARPMTPEELLATEDEPSALLDSGELIRRQQLDALRGPKGDEPDLPQTRSVATPEERPDDQELSHAEAAVIWLALATHSKAEDVVGTGPDPKEPDPDLNG
jgi:hypothetical protein